MFKSLLNSVRLLLAYFLFVVATSEDEKDGCQLQLECQRNTSYSLRIPVRSSAGRQGPQGPPGPPGLPGKSFEVDNLPKETIQMLLRKLSAHTRKASFFVGIKSNLYNYSNSLKDVYKPIKSAKGINFNDILIMDNVMTNEENCYNAYDGIFTAPVKGTYVFSLTVSASSVENVAVSLMHNDQQLFVVWANGPWSTSSNQAVLNLIKDDVIWLRRHNSSSYPYAFMYSSFMGYILHEEYT